MGNVLSKAILCGANSYRKIGRAKQQWLGETRCTGHLQTLKVKDFLEKGCLCTVYCTAGISPSP